MTTWLAVVAVGAISYLMRSVPLVVRWSAGRHDGAAARAATAAGLAALVALVAGALRHFADAGSAPGLGALVAVSVAVTLARHHRSPIVAVGTALTLYLGVTAVAGAA